MERIKPPPSVLFHGWLLENENDPLPRTIYLPPPPPTSPFPPSLSLSLFASSLPPPPTQGRSDATRTVSPYPSPSPAPTISQPTNWPSTRAGVCVSAETVVSRCSCIYSRSLRSSCSILSVSCEQACLPRSEQAKDNRPPHLSLTHTHHSPRQPTLTSLLALLHTHLPPSILPSPPVHTLAVGTLFLPTP